ncbi:MAG: hypothetical protein DRO90_03235 [Candidatus Altiarchaeales archaeon]|nr:MAG: hypothetical protein DRO95_00550 [Candidatus Altiarchaeales archaeon]RLI93682.1 MAG: hypothetical protein DRO90_03235 [Candidatus Altiarchaeales archaeon]RLI95075.1 MAG: hypothetical protein DRO94_01345 [Candidatus Altiarchaeales archaeon]HDO82192.1 protein translocase subunit SecF [Candidatus Altiarchaeales archaeon]HEX54841.1 protein translocase subunit SecF [Candidatus Altiarchaeales archaeon]
MSEIFNAMYSGITSRINYKSLLFVPLILLGFMLFTILMKGIAMGIDFRGGTLITVTLNKNQSIDIDKLKLSLDELNLMDLEIYSGRDIVTGSEILTIRTLSIVNESEIKPILERYLGRLRDTDVATIILKDQPPSDLEEKLRLRLRQNVDLNFSQDGKILEISAYELDGNKLREILSYYLNENLTVSIDKKNFHMKTIGPTLGRAFWSQGMKSAIIAYILIIFVIFVAFRDLIPSIAVILAATFDVIFALGGMSIFRIYLEPASLVAIIMLIGYSVDTNILLTTRVLRKRTGSVNDRIDNAMKTGLTMSITTICVMCVISIISILTNIDVLASISSVLLMGLIGDLISTWLMNTGILKWYVEEKGGKLRILKKRLR